MISYLQTKLVLIILIVLFVSTLTTLVSAHESSQQDFKQLENTLRTYDDLYESSVMVVGTIHFSQYEMKPQDRKALDKLVERLALYQPTKIMLEWEPKHQDSVNKEFTGFLNDEFAIDGLRNEAYQLGFRIGKVVGLTELHLFDDQTEYIGSLEDFSFDSMFKYANLNDKGFYDKHEKTMIENYAFNQAIYSSLDIYHHVALLNSPRAQRANSQRMHMYENRVGVQDTWIGPDWLGRWYQRNLRMSSNVLKVSSPGDRILIIVGDNHKWVLEEFFNAIPEYRVDSSWEFLTGTQELD